MSAIPDVSVVVPTYQRAALLGASLESLLAQEGVAFEVIVVDDGSTDGTAAFLETHPDRRIRPVIRPHGGIAAARNAGVAAARAPLVAFHDSDDTALPGRLAVPAAYLGAHPDVDVVIQNGLMLPAEGDAAGREAPWIAPAVARTLAGRTLGFADVFRWNLGQLQGMCFTRRALARAGPFDPSFRILDDLDLVLRASLGGATVFLDVPAFAYRRHAAGISRDRSTVREEAIRLADKLAREHPEVLALVGPATFARRQARRYVRLASARAEAGDAAGARAAMAEARALRPGSLAYHLRALWLALRARGVS
jgi:glycosyltransferase involved in cell wall biosynthesis